MAELAPQDEFFVSDKDPGYIYKWCNTRERVMMQRSRQGYEVVNTPEDIPEAVRLANPQLVPTTETVRRRGDLILMRIRKDVHEKNVAGPIKAAKERNAVALDTMIAQSDDNIKRAMKKAGIPDNQVRSHMIFPDTFGAHNER